MSKLPTNQLYALCMSQFHRQLESDSTIVGFSVLGDRYDKDLPLDEQKKCADALVLCGHIACFHYYDYKISYEMLSRALDVIKDNEELSYLLPKLYVNIGNLFISSSVHLKSESLVSIGDKYLARALDEARKNEDWEYYTRAYCYLTAFLLRQGKTAKLDEVVTKDNFDIVPSATSNYQAFRSWHFGMLSMKSGDKHEARNWFRKDNQLVSRDNLQHRFETLSLSTIACTFEMENQLDSALTVYESMLSLAKQHNIFDVIAKAYLLMSDIYTKKGDKGKYKVNYENYCLLKDSLETKSGIVEVGEKHFLALIRQETENSQKLRFRNTQYIIAYVLLTIVLLVIVVLLVILHRKNAYLKSKNQLLYERVKNEINNKEPETEAVKYKGSALNDVEKQRIVNAIRKAMEDPNVVCQPNMTIEQLSALIDSNTRYVSQAINECMGTNFSMLLAKARVHQACLRLENPDVYGTLTIEAIGKAVGFRSRNSLYTSFKRFTGLTPSEYQKFSRKKV